LHVLGEFLGSVRNGLDLPGQVSTLTLFQGLFPLRAFAHIPLCSKQIFPTAVAGWLMFLG
jgi:hypothetical protein